MEVLVRSEGINPLIRCPQPWDPAPEDKPSQCQDFRVGGAILQESLRESDGYRKLILYS